MSAGRRRTVRDERRRSYGQNFLVDKTAIDRLIATADVRSDEFVVEIGAGTGALTVPLARAGARVLAVERDPVWVRRLRSKLEADDLADRVTVVRGDLRSLHFPDDPYRVISSPPFGQTTALLARLLDRPAEGPTRADLLVQLEVARKRSALPPTTLRSAAWAPWWLFEIGPRVPARAFRPVPQVDAALLSIRRRDPPLLPGWLAPSMRDLLRPGWQPGEQPRG